MVERPAMTAKPIVVLFSLLALAACDSTPKQPAAPSGETKATATPAAQTPAKTPETKPATPATDTMNVYSLSLKTLEGEKADLSQYAGKVTLLVNVASQCGYTPQYQGLQALHAELKDKGFAVLGFPCNDFGAQEPGSAQDIRTFCTTKYKVDFPMFEKLQTKAGNGQSDLYAMLQKATGKLPNWNFCKYLVGKDGKVIQFYASGTAPDSKELRAAIEGALK